MSAAPSEDEPAAETPPAPAAAPDETPPSGEAAAARVILVTVDGVRWEDVFGAAETMPNLHRLVGEAGTALGGPGCLHDVRASGPNFVSLPGYLEMFTGKASVCTHNGCPPVETMTVVDEARQAAHRIAEVAVVASWSKYAHAVARDRRSIVLSAGAHAIGMDAAKTDAKLRYYLETGSANAGYPGYGDYRPDVHTARVALRYLETMSPRLMVVGLGDADEHAHRGDIAGYRRAIQRADDFIADLERTLARMGDDGKQTAVVVTTDHGRGQSLRGHGAAFPESARVFVAAFGAGIAHRGVTCGTQPLRLSHLAGAMRSLLALESDAEPGPLAEQLLAR